MGFWDTVGRVGLGIATGGISEGVRAVHGATQNDFRAQGVGIDDYDERKKRFATALGASQARTTQMDTAPQAQWRGDQRNFAAQLQSQANGTAGPSAAQSLMNSAQDRNISQSMAQAASARGMNPAMAARLAQQNAAQANVGIVQQGAALRAQEQQQAQQLYSQQLAAGRTQDLGLAQTQAEVALKQQSQNDTMAQFYQSMDLQQALERQKADMQAQNINAGVATANQQATTNLIGGVLNAGASVGAMAAKSDERAKKGVKSGSGDVREFLDAIQAHKYRYKDEKDGEGEFVSPMAQELEKSEIGRQMVEDTPDGKMVKYDGHGFGAILAAQADLNARLKKIEGKGSK